MNDLGSRQLPAAANGIPHPGSYSTDQGNVTQVCPGIHAIYRIPTEGAASNHTKEFTAAAITEEAYQRAILTAKAMAATAWRVLADDDFAETVRSEFVQHHGEA
jgi:hypothetical protein